MPSVCKENFTKNVTKTCWPNWAEVGFLLKIVTSAKNVYHKSSQSFAYRAHVRTPKFVQTIFSLQPSE